jgi:hypothetical protein
MAEKMNAPTMLAHSSGLKILYGPVGAIEGRGLRVEGKG